MPQKLIDLGIVLILLLGIVLFRGPRRARLGNLAAAFAMLCGVVVILVRHSVSPISVLLVFAVAGTAAGLYLALRVGMIRIPAMVALQNGMGGMASLLVSFVELTRTQTTVALPAAEVASLLGIVTGAATFTGSVVAGGRLARLLSERPLVLPRHNLVFAGSGLLAALLMLPALWADGFGTSPVIAATLGVVAGGLGIVFAIRVGGADMPVLISFLNAGTGLAAAFCGIGLGNWLLIACGAMVGVSGMILTQVMCQAMNRSLVNVFAGIGSLRDPSAALPVGPSAEAESVGEEGRLGSEASQACRTGIENAAGLGRGGDLHSTQAHGRGDAALPPEPVLSSTSSESADPFTKAIEAARNAQSVIIVPGYGMALADAQEETVRLAERLAGMGKSVLFAIHPVAGRMPGHMHVLLAEAEVDYGMIRELKDVNPEFARTDLVLVVGACDVVNPAAIQSTGTPISGMPILRAHEARQVIVCNLDDRPGYSGVENTLYRQPHSILLLGDAKETLARLLQGLG